MRQIKILKNTKHSELGLEIEKRIAQSLAFEVTDDELIKILDKIRKGDIESIPGFLKASEGMIYKVMLLLPDSRFSIDERFNFARQALKKLALQELNSTKRENLLRFGAFNVKQALLVLKMQPEDVV